MANGARQAVQNATRLSEIEFPEFTAKLITDTFNAITTSYINQTAQYITLVQAVSQSLEEFINNTADDISADDIGAFLVATRGINDDARNFLLGDPVASAMLSAAEATSLNSALALPSAAGALAAATPAARGSLNATNKETITQAVARRIASNKYDLLQTMVRQGVLRLYVDNGTIETRLTFTTFGTSTSSSETNRFRIEGKLGVGLNEEAHVNEKGGGILGLLAGGLKAVVGAGLSGQSSSRLTVSTAKETQRDVSGSRVQIFGRVKLNFKTDLVPLAAPTS